MPNFIHREYKTVYIRDVVRMDLDDLITMMSGDTSAPAYWVDGVLFVAFSAEPSESISKKEIEGIVYIEKMLFTKYPVFSRTARSAINYEIPVVNMQNSKLFGELVKWLKGQPFWND